MSSGYLTPIVHLRRRNEKGLEGVHLKNKWEIDGERNVSIVVLCEKHARPIG